MQEARKRTEWDMDKKNSIAESIDAFLHVHETEQILGVLRKGQEIEQNEP